MRWKGKKRKIKAACMAAFVYLAGLALCIGILRAAQQTRQILYGGETVMVQMTQIQEAKDASEAYQITFGGGEWVWEIYIPEKSYAAVIAEKLPPSMTKALFRLLCVAEELVNQTTERIQLRFSDAI